MQHAKLPGRPQRAHFFFLYTAVRAAAPPQVAHHPVCHFKYVAQLTPNRFYSIAVRTALR
jgi:hypothetical protein